MKKALNLTILSGMGISQQEAVPMIARAGFDGCFWVAQENTPLSSVAASVREAGLSMQFIHAPVSKVDTLWMDCPEGKDRLNSFLYWIRQCSENGIPVMVMHVWTKFAPIEPNLLGISRFQALLDAAQKEGVKLAFENAEVGKFLSAVRNNLWEHPAAGFCFDTGHELCYSDGKDQLAEFGDNLLCTHLNDNMGRTGPEITSADDCHMMPFDGIADWENIAGRLNRVHFHDTLTFELKMQNKPGRHTHDRYLSMEPEELLRLAFEKACRFEKLMTDRLAE